MPIVNKLLAYVYFIGTGHYAKQFKPSEQEKQLTEFYISKSRSVTGPATGLRSRWPRSQYCDLQEGQFQDLSRKCPLSVQAKSLHVYF